MAKKGPEATLSWDVSGYYMYLPAFFIYRDLKKCHFQREILEKYIPTPNFQQAFIHEPSGNYVMKYSVGQAMVFSPFFALAHLWALGDPKYPPDGFSLPYQFMISIGMLFITAIGLLFLSKSLHYYFDELSVSLTILSLAIGTNYLNYSAIDGAMTHNSLFAIYAILIYLCIQFYRKPSIYLSAGIGICVGLAALIRPTEIISCLIPLLWGVNLLNVDSISKRLSFLKVNWINLITAIIICLSIGAIQLIYWKYVSGEWIVYSYQDQGFSWLSPHIMDCLFSYKSGWLIYSPLMSLALLGFIPLYYNRRHLFFGVFIFAFLFMYIAFSWDVWWYGGSLGQRAMVQCYPILAFSLCALFDVIIKRASNWIKLPFAVVAIVFIYANLWFTHQVHRGGLVHVGEMNKLYFWKVLFTYHKNPDHIKLFDGVEEVYEGALNNRKLIFQDTSFAQVLNHANQFSKTVSLPIKDLPTPFDWIRVSVDASIKYKEWNTWAMTQFIVELKNHSEVVHTSMMRIQRHLSEFQTKRIYLDIRNSNEPYTTVNVLFWNAEGKQEIILNNLTLETFNEN